MIQTNPPPQHRIAPDPKGGWSNEIFRFTDARISPQIASKRAQVAAVFDRDGHHRLEAEMWVNDRARNIRPKAAPPKRQLAGEWLWADTLLPHFGHFLMENTARLWALTEIGRPTGLLFAARWRRSAPQALRQYQKDLLAMLGVQMPVRVIRRPFEVESLLVPGPGLGIGEISAGTGPMRQFLKDRLLDPGGSARNRRIYISRSRLPNTFGGFVGERYIEAALSEAGYEIFHPEDHDLKSQAETYRSARHIVASDNSALHLVAMVCSADTKIAVIQRRARNGPQCANIMRHLDSFLPGQTVLIDARLAAWRRFTMENQGWHRVVLDLPKLQTSLKEHGFIGSDESTWRNLTSSEIAADIDPSFEPVPDYPPD